MAVCFYEAFLQGTYQLQTIGDRLGFQALGVGVSAEPSLAEFAAVAQAISDTITVPLCTILPFDYTLQNIYLTRYDDGGNVATIPGYFNVIGVAGGVDERTDGQGLCAIFKKQVGLGEVIRIGGSIPRRGYVAVGPMASSNIQDNMYLTAGLIASPEYAALRAALAAEPDVDIPDYELRPAVLSHWMPSTDPDEPGETVTEITGYSYVLGVITRSKASFRRSRTEGP